jgi:hypothetical protein
MHTPPHAMSDNRKEGTVENGTIPRGTKESSQSVKDVKLRKRNFKV